MGRYVIITEDIKQGKMCWRARNEKIVEEGTEKCELETVQKEELKTCKDP